MRGWQRHARVIVALIGIATAAAVYLTLGERRHAAARLTGSQLPPRVVAQSTNGRLEHVTGIAPTYRVQAAQFTTYDDGSTRGRDVTIEAPNRDGRHFIVSARESYATKGNADIQLNDSIDLREDDGFGLKTAKATFNQSTGVARADGAVTFGKGRMTGSGSGVTYDEHADVLDITDRAQVDIAPIGNAAAMTFRGQAATLDRVHHLLIVLGNVQVTHGPQVIGATSATAHLSDSDDRVLAVELREGARVEGGLGTVASMNAHDIDLQYAEDGRTIEHASLRGQGAITMTGAGGSAGRRLEGEALEIALRADQSLEHLTGSGGVTMTMPAADGAPARTVRGRTVDGKAGADGSLTSARFAGEVSFTEDTRTGTARGATSGVLDLQMVDNALATAVFTERATFRDGDLSARAAEAQYDPVAAKLSLLRPDQRGDPNVADERVSIDAEAIEIGLDARQITAKRRVRSTLSAERENGRGSAAADDNHLPGLLQQNQPVQISADIVHYDGERGVARYDEHAWLTQGDTEIRARSIELQQKRGDLTAVDGVRSSIVLDTGLSTGEANELRYVDETRTITYTAARPTAGAAPAPPAHLSGAQGDLRARLIRVFLAKAESKLERLEAEADVVSKIEARTVRGGSLSYRAADESYTVNGTGAAPARLEEGCQEVEAPALTFNKSTDTMSITGRGVRRTKSTKKASCQ